MKKHYLSQVSVLLVFFLLVFVCNKSDQDLTNPTGKPSITIDEASAYFKEIVLPAVTVENGRSNNTEKWKRQIRWDRAHQTTIGKQNDIVVVPLEFNNFSQSNRYSQLWIYPSSKGEITYRIAEYIVDITEYRKQENSELKISMES